MVGDKMAMKKTSLIQAKHEIQRLREEIKYHEKKYYVDNDPQISDYEFDKLVKKLKELESQFPELITPDSPTQRVGEQALAGFATVEHRTPMLSLDNCYSIEELKEFEDRIQKIIPGERIEYVAELKIDGLGISAIYRDGKYVQAVTRGDGFRGDDVTPNVKTIKSMPLSIKDSREIEVRGEVYLPFSSFQKINQEKEKKVNLSLPIPGTQPPVPFASLTPRKSLRGNWMSSSTISLSKEKSGRPNGRICRL